MRPTQFELKIDLGNEAFDNEGHFEVAELQRILIETADRICQSVPTDDLLFIRDINGNKIGSFVFEIDEEEVPDDHEIY